jgi:hypothetical protein
MPKSPKSKSNNQSDEPVTQFFNFPEPWVKDYDPAIHGFRPPSHFQGPAPANLPPPYQNPPARSQAEMQGKGPQNNQPFHPHQPVSNNSWAAPAPQQAQWNPNGVYGGLRESWKSGLPWWGWLIIVLAALVILLIVVSLLKIFAGF